MNLLQPKREGRQVEFKEYEEFKEPETFRPDPSGRFNKGLTIVSTPIRRHS